MSTPPRTPPASPPITPRTKEEEKWDKYRFRLQRLFRLYPQHTTEIPENITLQEMKKMFKSKVELIKQEERIKEERAKQQALRYAVNLMREFEAKTHISDQN